MEKIDISHKTIVFTTFFLLGLFFIYLIRDVILLLFMSIIFMFALSPMINKLEQRKIPRQAAILLIYLFFFWFSNWSYCFFSANGYSPNHSSG